MKRAALYLRVSTLDQHPETQVHDLRQMATQRGYQIVAEFTDRISGTKAKRPGLDQLTPAAVSSMSFWYGHRTESPGR
jgi:DNA invertase Pin-like site-specific DNA recombinase